MGSYGMYDHTGQWLYNVVMSADGDLDLQGQGTYFPSLGRAQEASETMLLETVVQKVDENAPERCLLGLLEMLPARTRSQLEPLLERRAGSAGQRSTHAPGHLQPQRVPRGDRLSQPFPAHRRCGGRTGGELLVLEQG
ncbi:MAG: hypothetical protein R6U00_06480 [Prochlorococcaceae cyanobacterium]